MMRKKILTLLLFLGMLSLAVTGDPQPYQQADNTWISIGGTVESVDDDSFFLDYGEGKITVEMDDWDWYSDTGALEKGDKVNVQGMIDDDFYEIATIEASSVYVHRLGRYFYASPADEEGAYYYTTVYPVVLTTINVRGRVTSVSHDEFTLDTGPRQMTVEVEEMAYNPLDDEGYQKVRVGDRVSVTGEMDYDLFEGRELVADSVIVLENSK